MSFEANGDSQSWTERRLVVRSLRHAKAAEASLRTRVAKAQTQVEALNQRGRGRKRFEEMDELRQAATSLVQRHQVEDFLWLRYDQQATVHPVRAYRNREAGIKVERQATVEVRVDEDMLARAVSRLGWRIYVTNQVREQLSLAQAVLAYRSEYLVERSLGRLKGRPLSLTPMYGQRDDHATGVIRLLSIALRVLTLIEFGGRRQLA
jgi:transposase